MTGANMKPINKPFQYHSAAESAKPGYLKRRLAEYRKRVQQQSEQPTADVLEITPGAWLARKGAK